MGNMTSGNIKKDNELMDDTTNQSPAVILDLTEAQELMGFSAALNELKLGQTVARVGWNGKGMWLAMQWPDANSKMTLPYLYLNYPGARVPWLASQTDLLAEDWIKVGPAK